MNEILFLLFAFFTVFLSIKLSYYADALSKSGKISKAVVGGVLLAGITSLPEFVTCFSAVVVGNGYLAMGDILGSNIFNIFMICVFDIIFIRNTIFSKLDSNHNTVIVLLIINYIVLFLYIFGVLGFSIFSIGIPSFVIVISYIFYIKKKVDIKNEIVINSLYDNRLVFRFIVTTILMIVSSVCLTLIVNKFSVSYPSFSSSFLGAIFLGVTTSLPEVITFYTLININNYDLAFSNIIGSNLFNLLVLSLCDIVLPGIVVYSFVDENTIYLVLLGFLFSFACLLCINNKKMFRYGVLSFVVVLCYFVFWFFNFLS